MEGSIILQVDDYFLFRTAEFLRDEEGAFSFLKVNRESCWGSIILLPIAYGYG